jgi:hypothetical protein
MGGMFAGVFSGDYVVWHNVPAQITVNLTTPLTSVTKIEVVVGLNKYNPDADIKIWSRGSPLGTFTFLSSMAVVNMPELPSDGKFVDVTYQASFPTTLMNDFRVVITKDGVEARELTPVKQYYVYNNQPSPIVGGSKFNINELGWKTSEVFETIFRYLDAPISVEHTVDLETETHGTLPETRIRNDDLLARVADNEEITGEWSFADGQIIVERGTELPTGVIKSGRLFCKEPEESLYLGNGVGWTKLIQETELQAALALSVPVVQRFSFSAPTTSVILDYTVNVTAPVWLTHETLPQKYGKDFTITGNLLEWVSAEDPAMNGDVEVIYYRAA